jgi:predicted Zn-dependent protease
MTAVAKPCYRMKPLEPPDSFHVNAAQGWIGLGDYAAANDELKQIDDVNSAHPDVLQVRWRIYAHAGRWDTCLRISTLLTTITPERRSGWICRAHTLDKLGRTRKAKDLLLSVETDFHSDSAILLHLARFCWGLGQIGEAKQWLGKALLVATGLE